MPVNRGQIRMNVCRRSDPTDSLSIGSNFFARVRAEIDEATDFAEAAPDADPATLARHVYGSEK